MTLNQLADLVSEETGVDIRTQSRKTKYVVAILQRVYSWLHTWFYNRSNIVMKKKTNKWGTRKENWRLLVTLSQAGIPTNDFGSKDTLDELEVGIGKEYMPQTSKKTQYSLIIIWAASF